MPPTYSAVKVDGKRAYDLARKEKDVELKPKILVIDEIELLECKLNEEHNTSVSSEGSPNSSLQGEAEDLHSSLSAIPRTGMRNKAFLTAPIDAPEADTYPSITIRVVCSKGTYIRALARDIGKALSSGAHLTALRRTRVGDVTADQCLPMDTFPEWLQQQDIVKSQAVN